MTWSNLEYIADKLSSKLKEKVDEYLILVDESKKRMLKLANGEASVTQSWDNIEIGLYIARGNGKMLSIGLSTTSPEKAVGNIISLLDSMEPSPMYAPLPEASGEDYSLTDQAIIQYLEGTRELDLAGDLALSEIGNSAGMAEIRYSKIMLANSMGGFLRGEKTKFTGYIRVFKGDRSGQWSWTSPRYDGGKQAKLSIEKARDLAEECSRLPMGKIEPGEYRVLLSPMIAGNLVGELVRAANAGRIVYGMSFINPGMIGEKLFSSMLTIRDEPRNPELPGYTSFDDEGVSTKDKSVVEKGVLRTILHNSKTAKLMKTRTTGNAGIIMPRSFNLNVSPGDSPLSELLETLGNGLYLTNNWYTRYQNYSEGIFSTVSRDSVFLVKNGEFKACLNRVRVADKMINLFSNIEALGREVWPLEWWEIKPSAFIPHILVGKTGVSLPEI
ncbi:MAG: TldD/PmbA family protein [Desulfurococcales archaeon]|nr:TldD/PmbA family protein [Desulfurococcales archaeon]